MLLLLLDTVQLQLIMILRPLQSASAWRKSRILAGKCEKKHISSFRPTRFGFWCPEVCFHNAGISKHLHQIVESVKETLLLCEKSGSVPKQ